MKYYGKIINNEDIVNKQYVDENIPTKTSELDNDSGFIDENYHDGTKQAKLVSGTNIKTINNQSLLGSGNIEIQGGGITLDTLQPFEEIT